MCLNAAETNLGPADACLDLPAGELYFTTGLTVQQQVALARRLLDDAGFAQPLTAGSVVGPCGHRLHVPAVSRPEGLRAAG